MELRSRSSSRHRFNDGLSQALSLVAGPVLFGFLGWLLDRSLGTGPVLMLTLGIFGFLGAVVALYYRYKEAMEREEADKPWSRRTW